MQYPIYIARRTPYNSLEGPARKITPIGILGSEELAVTMHDCIEDIMILI
jgi:hypothetical protein